MQNTTRAGGRHARRTRAEWTVDVVKWRQSGLSSEVYAAERGLNRSSLLAWSAKLGPHIAEPELLPSEVKPVRFVPLRVREQEPSETRLPSSAGSVEILLSNGRSVRVTGAVKAAELSQVIAVVEGTARC